MYVLLKLTLRSKLKAATASALAFVRQLSRIGHVLTAPCTLLHSPTPAASAPQSAKSTYARGTTETARIRKHTSSFI